MATSSSFPPIQYHADIQRLSCALNRQTDRQLQHQQYWSSRHFIEPSNTTK